MVNDEIISLSPLYYLSSYAFFLILFIPNSSPNPNSSLLQFYNFPNNSSHPHHHLLDSLNSSLPSNQGILRGFSLDFDFDYFLLLIVLFKVCIFLCWFALDSIVLVLVSIRRKLWIR